MTIKEQIRKIALEILSHRPDGMRFSELTRAIEEDHPLFNLNTIHGATWNLEAIYPKEIYKKDLASGFAVCPL